MRVEGALPTDPPCLALRACGCTTLTTLAYAARIVSPVAIRVGTK
jgi:hypothetical protein